MFREVYCLEAPMESESEARLTNKDLFSPAASMGTRVRRSRFDLRFHFRRRAAHSGGAGLPLAESPPRIPTRQAALAAVPVHPWPAKGVSWIGDNTPNTPSGGDAGRTR